MPDYRSRSHEKDEDEFCKNARKIWRRPASHPIQIQSSVNSVLLMDTEERTENRTLFDTEMVSPSVRQRAGDARIVDLTSEDESDAERGNANHHLYPQDLQMHPDSRELPLNELSSLNFASMCNLFSNSLQSACSVPSQVDRLPYRGETSASMVTSGFQHCAAEAVRYLIEEEHMSPTDPLVVGLQQHLGMRERHLDPERVLNDYMATQRLLLLSSSIHAGSWEDSDVADDHFGEDDDDQFDDEIEDEAADCSLVQSLTHLASTYLMEMCQTAQNGFKTSDRLPTVMSPSESHGTSSSQGSNTLCSDYLPVDDRRNATSPSPSI